MAARCPNCTRKVHIWSNHSGFCSKRCREESRSACLNCGKVGLFKHERLGCCSDECRFWYVTTLLGYDHEYLLTPAWDKVVYHVRLPSGNAEISSLQLDELEFERAHETILVVAAPAWISRVKVLAELPYQRFENPAWEHLRRDGTLSPEELERFRRMCYDDPLLYHKLGEHVFQKIRGHGGTSPITPSSALQLAPGGVPMIPQATAGYQQALPAPQPTAYLPQPPASYAPPPPLPLQIGQGGGSTLIAAAPEEFAARIRTLFALRGYAVSTANGDSVNTLLLTKGDKQAIAVYHWQEGMVDPEPVRQFLALMTSWDMSHGYFVSNGHFTLQVEDMVAGRPVQLIDGRELTSLLKAASDAGDANGTHAAGTRSLRGVTSALDGRGAHTGPNGVDPAQKGTRAENDDGATTSLQAQTMVLEGAPAEETVEG